MTRTKFNVPRLKSVPGQWCDTLKTEPSFRAMATLLSYITNAMTLETGTHIKGRFYVIECPKVDTVPGQSSHATALINVLWYSPYVICQRCLNKLNIKYNMIVCGGGGVNNVIPLAHRAWEISTVPYAPPHALSYTCALI